VTTVAENIALKTRQIRELELLYQRPPDAVRLLAVSKRQGIDKIRQANAAGISDFGENYLQEAVDKIHALADLDLSWHFIGPIQTNKTRGIAELFDWVHSVDREKIARRLSEQRSESQQALNVCVQINLSAETSKSGIDLVQTADLCKLIAGLPNLQLRGLMAIPAPLPGLAEQRACFRELATEFKKLQLSYPGMDTLSMGMSNDFEAAIAEGSTMVRLGTALFGPRN
jgi:PLP dependent protein